MTERQQLAELSQRYEKRFFLVPYRFITTRRS
jgi:hypothetical protein